jgi:hypothetical protein
LYWEYYAKSEKASNTHMKPTYVIQKVVTNIAVLDQNNIGKE